MLERRDKILDFSATLETSDRSFNTYFALRSVSLSLSFFFLFFTHHITRIRYMALVVGPQPTHTPPTEEASIRAARCNAEQGRERQPSDGDLARHEGTQGGRCDAACKHDHTRKAGRRVSTVSTTTTTTSVLPQEPRERTTS